MIGITETLVLILSIILISIYLWFKSKFSYWKSYDVPHKKPNFFFGNLRKLVLQRESSTELFNSLYYHKNAKEQSIFGFYLFDTPALMIRDLNLIKRIFIKDSKFFSDRYRKSTTKDILGTYNLITVRNPLWKIMRTKLTSVFTSGKIKQMFNSVNDIGQQFDDYISKITEKSDVIEIELRELCALYNTDVNASVSYGLNSNCLKNEKSEFRQNGRSLFKLSLYRAFEFIVLILWPKMSNFFKVRLFSKSVTKFLRDTINYTMMERRKSGNQRNDLIDSLLTIQDEVKNSNEPIIKTISNDMLVAQAGIFFIAGFEPTSSNMSFCLYELSKNEKIQNKLRNEIKETLAKNDVISLDIVQDLKYLDMIVMETLRLYPGLVFYERQCTLEKKTDFYSLEPFHKFKIPCGMPVYAPAFAIQRDPEYFDCPNEFMPERFAAENKHNLKWDAYMPFGIGPHNCIGERFGLIQVKVGLFHFFKNHSIRPCSRTHKTMKFAKSILYQPEGGIYCEIVKDIK